MKNLSIINRINYNEMADSIRHIEKPHFERSLFKPIEAKYKYVQIAWAVLSYFLLAGFAVLLLPFGIYWLAVAESAIIAAFAINVYILNKAYKYKGYILGEHDISFRSGVIFTKITTIPYTKIQQVSLARNPMSKLFGLYSVEVVNGAQAISSISIPGLKEDDAKLIKKYVTEKLRKCND